MKNNYKKPETRIIHLADDICLSASSPSVYIVNDDDVYVDPEFEAE